MDVSKAVLSLENLSKDKHLPARVEVTIGVPAVGGNLKVSRGDILHVLELANVPEVTADFTGEIMIAKRIFKPGNFEVSIPLDYTGKLKIVNEIKSYQVVSQIFEDMPRFVRVMEKLIIPNGQFFTELEAGSVIEVVSRHHGQQHGFKRETDELRVRCKYLGFDTDVNILVNTRGVFVSHPDTTLYSMREAVERYPLPVVAVFQEEDFLYNLFADKFPLAIKTGFSAPEAVRLLKTVTHETYVCRLEQQNDQQPHDPSSEILLLNASSPEVKNIRVRLLDSETSPRPDYEIPVFKRGTLEKALRRPELVQIDDGDDDGYEEVLPDDKLVKELQPTKNKKMLGECVKSKSSSTSEIATKMAAASNQSERDSPSMLSAGISKLKGFFRHQHRLHVSRSDSAPAPVDRSDDVPEGLTETQQSSNTGSHKLARVYSVFPSRGASEETSSNLYDDINETEMMLDVATSRNTDADKGYITPVAKTKPVVLKKPNPKQTDAPDTHFTEESEVKDIPDVGLSVAKHKPLVYKKPKPKQSDTPESHSTEESDSRKLNVEDIRDNELAVLDAKTKLHKQHFDASVQNIHFDTENPKEFQTLTVDELCERFTYCRLEKLATATKLQSLNAQYFSEIEKDVLRADPFNLSNIEITKFVKLKEGWLPKV